MGLLFEYVSPGVGLIACVKGVGSEEVGSAADVVVRHVWVTDGRCEGFTGQNRSERPQWQKYKR